ncbi:1538_t:CDS:2, partial [Racocetra persica]
DIIAFNVNSLVDLEDHSAKISGIVSCRALSPDPLIIVQGKFRLFVKEKTRVDANAIMYNLNLTATDGSKYRFKGVKLLDNSNLLGALMDKSYWQRNLDNKSRRFYYTNGDAQSTTNKQKTGAFFKFTGFFASNLIQRTFTRFLPLQYTSNVNALTLQSFEKPRPEREEFTVISEDEVTTKLFRYKGGNKGPVLL